MGPELRCSAAFQDDEMSTTARPKTKPRGSLISAIDVGSTKVCCFIARVEDHDSLQIIGTGHQISHGVRAGSIVDMEAAAAAIGNAVNSAEQMAGETIRDVITNLSAVHAASHNVEIEVAIDGHQVSDLDMRRALAQAYQVEKPGETELIHALPTGYSIDGNKGIDDPRGMYGQMLGVSMHAVTANASACRNLAGCVATSHLQPGPLCVSPYASGLACLVEDEMRLGCTLIEMGGGTTEIAVFMGGNLVHVDSVPVGGGHVTNDIARGLTTTIAHAERIKTLYGSAISSVKDDRELIDVPQMGEEHASEGHHIPRSLLVGIIQPRMEETFEMVRALLEQSGFGQAAGRRVVLSGGASQLPGARDLAQLILDKQVRVGRPQYVAGLPDTGGGTSFATASGLLIHALRDGRDVAGISTQNPDGNGLWNRVGQWLKENL
jgi:cell division protein FtsA